MDSVEWSTFTAILLQAITVTLSAKPSKLKPEGGSFELVQMQF
jgi:hypothetical protein